MVLAARTLRDRTSAFVGSFVALVLGSAMLMAAVSVITSAGSAHLGGAAQGALESILSLFGFLAGLAAFLSIFVVASTFAFAVATRTRELALLRLVGATRNQLRRLVRAEALLVGMCGAVVGCVVGLGLAGVTIWLLVLLGVAPSGLRLELGGPTWYVAAPVAFGVAVLVTWLGAASAARRAGRIPPLAALAEADVDGRVMTGRRWFFGLLFLAGGVTATVFLPRLGGEAQVPITIFLADPFVIALVLLSPLFLGRLCAALGRSGTVTGLLATANLRGALRRTTSTAAPVALAVGICGGLIGASLAMASSAVTTVHDLYTSDVVVTGPVDRVLAEARALPGVAATPLGQAQVTVGPVGNAWNEPMTATVVDAATMGAALHLTGVTGSPARLHGATVMAGRELAADLGWHLGDTVPVRAPGSRWHGARLVAMFQDSALVEGLLVPRDFVPAPQQVHVTGDQARIAARLRATVPGVVITPTATWSGRIADENSTGLLTGSYLLSGFALLYTILAIANTTAMAFRTRRDEFRVLGRIGVDARQLRGMVRRESLVLAVAGSLVGCVVAIGTTVATWHALRHDVPDAPLTLPWLQLLVLTVLCTGIVTGVAAVAASTTGLEVGVSLGVAGRCRENMWRACVSRG
ncbi:MAG TPA: ABC transporter permease [Pseudonocardiaceae bacterium]|nr:ABC transporter permease [Pseudonocardiaceae bacterium]